CDGETDEGTCDDGNPCTDDACGGATGCEHLALDGGECTDGNPCTAADHCASGVCVGAAVTCNDQNPCTDDTCTETGGCLFEPNAGSCDDGDPCTVADACGGGSCTGVAVDCDCLDDGDCLALEDGDLCNGTLICAASSLPHRCVVDPATVASCPAAVGVNGPCLAATCDPETGACGFEAAGEGAPCDDGNPCQLADTCAAGACAAGLPANCNDGNPCTDDACSPLSGCTHGFNAKPCEDGNPCTLGDHCQGGACTPGPGPSCDDQNPCTDDACSPVTGCSHVPNAAPCSDGNACTTSDTCSGGACHGGASLDCNDQDPCTTDSCLLLTGCKHVINTAPCNDGNPCTTEDTCSLGVCGGTPVSCDDGNPCTDDACTAAGCKHQPNSSACSDGNTCTSGDHCAGGVCAFSQVVVCDDGNPCTTDFCSPVEGCLVLNNALPCNDGDACTTIDSCAGGACSGAALLECDDGNPCTDDTCDPGAGCVLTPNVDGCDDGNACTTVDVCGAGTCHGWVAPDCNDSNLCTTDTCDPALGCLHVHNTVPCNDGNACTTVDLCQGGSCTGSVPPSCGDGNPCTVDTCVPATGCAHAAILPCCGNLAVEPPEECDDGNQAGGDGCSGTCQDETPACRNGASLLSTAPGGTMAVCFNGSTCEQDYETLCPEGWRLCSQRQYAARNDGWGYSTGGKMGLGAIRCRGGGGAGHYTVHTGNLGQDEADNCHYGSSRPSCPAGYGCNEQGNLALCCKMNASCGNGAVDHPEEECDDGNQSDSDSCLPNCMTRFGGGC
ncbi:MAG: hypothetical protein FJ098_03475, partial [Deltaproteobacteria bacterium]|nr:hypothetical protein [Deltaproteobacteria bacterium]